MKKRKIIKIITCIISIITILATMVISTFALPATQVQEGYLPGAFEIAKEGYYTQGLTIIHGTQGATRNNINLVKNENDMHEARVDQVQITTQLTQAQYEKITSNDIVNRISQTLSTTQPNGIGNGLPMDNYKYSYDKYGIRIFPQAMEDNAESRITSYLHLNYKNVIISQNDIKKTSEGTISKESSLPYIQFKYPESFQISQIMQFIDAYINISYTFETFETETEETKETDKGSNWESEATITNYSYKTYPRTPSDMKKADKYRIATFAENGERYFRIYFVPSEEYWNNLRIINGDYSVDGAPTMIKFYQINVLMQTPETIRPYLFEPLNNELIIGDTYINYSRRNDKQKAYEEEYRLPSGVDNFTYIMKEYTQETIDVGDSFTSWITEAVSGFTNFEIIPNIRIVDILNVILILAIFLIILKVFAGG